MSRSANASRATLNVSAARVCGFRKWRAASAADDAGELVLDFDQPAQVVWSWGDLAHYNYSGEWNSARKRFASLDLAILFVMEELSQEIRQTAIVYIDHAPKQLTAKRVGILYRDWMSAMSADDGTEPDRRSGLSVIDTLANRRRDGAIPAAGRNEPADVRDL